MNEEHKSTPAEYTPDVTTVIQMRNNFNYLMDAIDKIHDALCPTRTWTWQMRVEQAITAAQDIGMKAVKG
jgi:hypothetical protein